MRLTRNLIITALVMLAAWIVVISMLVQKFD